MPGPAVVRVELTPETRALLLRLIHAIERLHVPITVETSSTNVFAESPPTK